MTQRDLNEDIATYEKVKQQIADGWTVFNSDEVKALINVMEFFKPSPTKKEELFPHWLRDRLEKEILKKAGPVSFEVLQMPPPADGNPVITWAMPSLPGLNCTWIYSEDEPWSTGCGHLWEFNEGGPAENDVKYCPFCGRFVHAHQDIENEEME